MYDITLFDLTTAQMSHESGDYATFREARAALKKIIEQGPDGDRLVLILETDSFSEYDVYSKDDVRVATAAIGQDRL